MKKKQTKADYLRSWHMPEKFRYQDLRYSSPPEKGVFWYYFSLYIRHRDVKMFGTCISCGKHITVETSQAGHFMPAASCGRDLLFDERNVNAECPACNAFDEAHLLGYADELDRRWGHATSTTLRARRKEYQARTSPVKDFKKAEYEAKIRALPSYTHQ